MHLGGYLSKSALSKHSTKPRKLLALLFLRVPLDQRTQRADLLSPWAALHQTLLDLKQQNLHFGMFVV